MTSVGAFSGFLVDHSLLCCRNLILSEEFRTLILPLGRFNSTQSTGLTKVYFPAKGLNQPKPGISGNLTTQSKFLVPWLIQHNETTACLGEHVRRYVWLTCNDILCSKSTC